LWFLLSFIHNFFADIRFLLWTYLATRATIPAVRESVEDPFLPSMQARRAATPSVSRRMGIRTSKAAAGLRVRTAGAWFRCRRPGASGRTGDEVETTGQVRATGASNSERLAGRHGVRMSRVQRRADRMTGYGELVQRRSNRVDPPRRETGQRRSEAGRSRKAAAGDRVADPPSFAGCLPVPGGRRERQAHLPVQAAPAMHWRAPRHVAELPDAAPSAPRRSRTSRSAQVSTGGDTAVGARSIHGRQRLRQGVCRFLDRARARFRGREPNGSERRRARHGPVVPPTPEPRPDAFSYSGHRSA
jgi:hypothetical protein